MRKHFRLFLVLTCCGALAMAYAPLAWSAATGKTASSKGSRTVGLEAAQSISTITGVAISPLLGVGAVGAYHYWNAAPERRPHLDWYAQPWFFIPALLLVVAVGAKDILGTAAPTALKKPFDVAETVENKVSGLVAAGAFVPLVFSIFPEAQGNGAGAADLSAMGFAAINGSSIINALLTPFAIIAFVFVFLLGHAINILILLSPFTTVDTVLKSMRLALLGMVTLTSFANPYVGAAFSCLIILVAYFIAGWTFRLSVLGTVFTWDFFTLRRRRFTPDEDRNWVFTSRKIKDTPIRTYGQLTRSKENKLVLEYRPWLILRKKTLELPEGEYVVGRGFFFPEVGKVQEEGRLHTLLDLPPRYKGHEETFARVHSLDRVEDVGLRRGIKAAMGWFKGKPQAEPKLISSEAVTT